MSTKIMMSRTPGRVVRLIGCSSAYPWKRWNAVEARSGGRLGRCRLGRCRLRRCRLRRFRNGEGAVGDVGGLVGGGAWVVPLVLGDGLAVVGIGDEDWDGPLLVGLGDGEGG